MSGRPDLRKRGHARHDREPLWRGSSAVIETVGHRGQRRGRSRLTRIGLVSIAVVAGSPDGNVGLRAAVRRRLHKGDATRASVPSRSPGPRGRLTVAALVMIIGQIAVDMSTARLVSSQALQQIDPGLGAAAGDADIVECPVPGDGRSPLNVPMDAIQPNASCELVDDRPWGARGQADQVWPGLRITGSAIRPPARGRTAARDRPVPCPRRP